MLPTYCVVWEGFAAERERITYQTVVSRCANCQSRPARACPRQLSVVVAIGCGVEGVELFVGASSCSSTKTAIGQQHQSSDREANQLHCGERRECKLTLCFERVLLHSWRRGLDLVGIGDEDLGGCKGWRLKAGERGIVLTSQNEG